MMRLVLAAMSVVFAGTPLLAQTLPLSDPGSRTTAVNPVSQPTISSGSLQLLELEGRFEQDVAKGGGKAFSSWFADDAVTLNEGKPAVQGQRAIAANTVWDPKDYQLTWTPSGAQMGPSNDAGFTWGHYVAKGKDASGQAFTFEGRYITFWKKIGSEWKVALDASAKDAPAAGDCCALPAPGAAAPVGHDGPGQ